MSLFQRGDVWWYEFWFAGRRIRESSKSPSKTVAKGAEQKRKRELEAGFNNFTDRRRERVRTFSDMADEFFDAYKLRLPQSVVFAGCAINHLKRLVGGKMLVDFNETAVIQYQNARLSEGAAPKSVNEEVGFMLRILGNPGDLLRSRLRKKKMLKLKVRQTVGKAYTPAEKDRMLEEARKARSPHIYFALTLALNAGMRDAEIRNLTWEQIDFTKKFLAVGRSKTEAGEGRTIPLNSSLFEVLSDYSAWYREKFREVRSEWYVFPFGKPSPSDPTRPVTTLKTAWNNVRTNAQVKGRWHDNRHTLITDLAESGAGDQTIMDIAGHVSKQMLKHYSHIRMEAKRHALEAIVTKRPATEESGQEGQAEGYPQKSPHGLQNGGKRTGKKQAAAKDESSPAAGNAENLYSETPTNTQHFDVGYPQKSPQSGISEDHRGVKRGRKSKILFGSSGRTRINSQTHFQQHAGQRMTPKTMKSSRNPINRAQMERVFAASLPLDSRLQLIVRSEVIFSATSNRECRA
jgi:integrase